MNPAQLLAHFHRLADAPDAIPRLRRFILDLAVRGKLVEQDPNDEASSVWLTRVGAKRHGESTLSLPPSWAWAQVGQVGDSRLGKMLDKGKNKGTPCRYLRNTNVRWSEFDLTDVREMRFEDAELAEFALRRGDVLICEGGEPGRAAVWDEREKDIYFQKAIHRIRFFDGVDAHFFVSAIRESADSGRLSAYFTGVGIKHLTGRGLASFVFPLPPLAEQHRIVAKVNELMVLCNRLAAAQVDRERRRDRLTAASFHRLNHPAGVRGRTDFSEHARFHLSHLRRLTTRPDQIPALRETILSLAVRGHLDAEGERPRHSVALRSFATLQNGYAFKSEWFSERGIRLLRNANVGHGVLNWGEAVCLPENRSEEFERFQLNEGDIVLSLDRPFISTGTKVARIQPQDTPSLLLQRVGRFQLKSSELCAEYLFLWLSSPHFTNQIDPGRSSGVPHISSKQVEAAEIFVPSLIEQHRIVAKVGQLLALCDRLEVQLTAARTERHRLLEAVLHEALVSAS